MRIERKFSEIWLVMTHPTTDPPSSSESDDYGRGGHGATSNPEVHRERYASTNWKYMITTILFFSSPFSSPSHTRSFHISLYSFYVR